MKIATYKTGHEIADTVADAIMEGIDGGDLRYTTSFCEEADIHIGYGILRGMDGIFREASRRGKPWFNLDRGYISPGHFSGYYRISLRGTQHTQGLADYLLGAGRLCALNQRFEPWRGFDKSKPVLVCPPSQYVANFFGIDYQQWLWDARTDVCIFRDKQCPDDGLPLSKQIKDCNYVLTFNSSVGWQAIAAGIPCVSDPTHSIVGSFFHNILLDNLSQIQESQRYKLFAAMSNLQLSLDEIRAGKLWPLLENLLSNDKPGLHRF